LTKQAPHARYLTPEFLGKHEAPGVPWSAKRFLGRAPSRSESASISKSLADLEKRGLVQTHQAVGKKQRTSHVSITVYGAIAALIIRQRLGR
jgi:hypothetical protein